MTEHEVWEDLPDSYDYPGSLVKLIPWLQARLDSIPEQYRERAEVDLECGYEDEPKGLSIGYYRPENAQERAARLEREELARLSAEERRAREHEFKMAFAAVVGALANEFRGEVRFSLEELLPRPFSSDPATMRVETSGGGRTDPLRRDVAIPGPGGSLDEFRRICEVGIRADIAALGVRPRSR
jgi:hypothetical protein